MNPKILSFASINIDEVYTVPHIVKPGETITSTHRQSNAGGKGGNASVAAARANAKVHVVGKVGTDGTWVRDIIKDSGADVSLVKIDKTATTGRAIIQLDSNTGENSIFLFPGANYQLTNDDARIACAQFGKGDWLMLTDETTAIADAIKYAHERSIRILWNPAPMRPDLVSKYPIDLVDILVVNETELAGLAEQIEGIQISQNESDRDYTLIAKSVMKELRTKVIVVTLGRAGSIAVVLKPTEDSHVVPIEGSRLKGSSDAKAISDDMISVISIPCAPVKSTQVKDTTAAGDTWVGYFIAQLTREQSNSPESISGQNGLITPAMVKRAMTVATYASGIAVTRLGAVPGIPVYKEVEEFLNTNTVPNKTE